VHHSAFDAEGNLLEIVQLIPENELPKEKKQSKLFMYGKYETK
jgi:hypothetical protein